LKIDKAIQSRINTGYNINSNKFENLDMGDYIENKLSLDERKKNKIIKNSNIKQIFEV
jgi:hypothetical protein